MAQANRTVMARLRVSLTTIVVPEYDAAISYYVNTLGFHLREDAALENGKRWVVVSPSTNDSHGILLAKATTDKQRRCIGDQSGGRVAFFLTTDDFDTTYAEFLRRGVDFHEEPRNEAYGLVAVFSDQFGNRWDLIQPR